jgi:hypothetical protein
METRQDSIQTLGILLRFFSSLSFLILFLLLFTASCLLFMLLLIPLSFLFIVLFIMICFVV